MTLDADHHHDRCPICGQQFIGYTDADMVVHIAENHEDRFEEYFSPRTDDKTCDNCGREYVTHMGECPFCHHDGPPYK